MSWTLRALRAEMLGTLRAAGRPAYLLGDEHCLVIGLEENLGYPVEL